MAGGAGPRRARRPAAPARGSRAVPARFESTAVRRRAPGGRAALRRPDARSRHRGGLGMSLLSVRGIVKAFPGVRALDGVDLDVEPGEVHCLLGQNGAGKSTLIRVLTGAHQPDAGMIRINDEPVQLNSPTAAIQRGIAAIYQELDLVPDLTVAENIFLGHEPSRY